MINYRLNVLEALKIKGFNTYVIRKQNIFGNAIIEKFRNNDTNISLKTVNTLLSLLECGFDDVFEFIPDNLDCTDRTKQSQFFVLHLVFLTMLVVDNLTKNMNIYSKMSEYSIPGILF